VIGKTTPACTAIIEEMQQEKKSVDEVGKGKRAGIKLPFKVNPKDKVFLWKNRQEIK